MLKDVERVWNGLTLDNCGEARLHCEYELENILAVVLIAPAREVRVVIGSNLLVGS